MKGDHIYVLCQKNIVAFQHHGIDCGDGTVIHFSKATGKGIITRDTRSTFKSLAIDGNLHTHKYEKCDSPSVVIHRAISKLGKGEYNLGLNNCEHFASWCKTGHKKSKQVNGVVGHPGTAATLGAAIGSIQVTTAASGIWGVLGMTTTAPLLGIGALPVAAIFGGAVLAYKFLNDD